MILDIDVTLFWIYTVYKLSFRVSENNYTHFLWVQFITSKFIKTYAMHVTLNVTYCQYCIKNMMKEEVISRQEVSYKKVNLN